MNILSLTTLRELLRLSLPMVVSQGAFAVMTFTDRWFMSAIDAAHIAAALGGGVAYFFTVSLFMGVITYANALVAQYYGAGAFGKCSRVVTQGMILIALITPILAVAAWFAAGLFAAMNHADQQVALEKTYYFVLMAGAPLLLARACIASYFAGIGRTNVVMVADIIGMAFNVPITWALVFGKLGAPALGIAGAGLGTLIATGVSLAVFVYFYLHSSHRNQFLVASSLVLDRGIFRRYLRLGAPSGFELFLNVATFNLFLLMFQSYGIVEGASMSIVFNWDMLSFVPMIGFNIGVMSLIGRFVGQGDMQRTNQVISSGFILALGYSGTLAVVFLLFRTNLVALFATPDVYFAEILELASAMFFGLVTYMMADAIVLICSGALRGAGDTRWLMLTSTSVHVIMLIAQYFIIMKSDYGPLTSWWIFVSMILVLAALYLARLMGGRWRQPDRLARVMVE